MTAEFNLDSIELSHAQSKQLLTHVLNLGDWTASKLDSYIKSLRREGVPFDPGETPGAPGTNVVYRFEHLMELSLALMLHRQGILRRDIIGLLVSMRGELRPLFQRAWSECNSGLGARVPVTVGGQHIVNASGIWLDLGLTYAFGGGLTAMGPKLLGPEGAIKTLATLNLQLTFRDPVRISDLAQEIVRMAPEIPTVHRGRQ